MASKYSKKNINTYNWLRKIPHYITIYFFLYPFYKIWFRIKIYGRENIPKGENLLIASNHLSYFDPTIISLTTLAPVAYMAKEELFQIPVLKQFILMYGAFAVDRKKLEISTIKTAKGIIQKGWHVSLFPEGTRGTEGSIGKIHEGISYLAKTTKTRVLPLGIVGSSTKRGPITVKIGKPIDYTLKPEEMKTQWLEAIEELTGFKSKDLEETRAESDNKEAVLQNS
jgi:1-acyl-sn-glycerol-3-phosphate acyltransferase